MKNKHNSSSDPEREKVKDQLRQLFNEYLGLVRDDIANSVHFFFEPYEDEDPIVYSKAAANALFMFTIIRKTEV